MKLKHLLVVILYMHCIEFFVISHRKSIHRRHRLYKKRHGIRKDRSGTRKDIISELPKSKSLILDAILNRAVKEIMQSITFEDGGKSISFDTGGKLAPQVNNNTLERGNYSNSSIGTSTTEPFFDPFTDQDVEEPTITNNGDKKEFVSLGNRDITDKNLRAVQRGKTGFSK